MDNLDEFDIEWSGGFLWITHATCTLTAILDDATVAGAVQWAREHTC